MKGSRNGICGAIDILTRKCHLVAYLPTVVCYVQIFE